MRWIILIFLNSLFAPLFAQEKFRLQGKLTTQEGIPLPNANVRYSIGTASYATGFTFTDISGSFLFLLNSNEDITLAIATLGFTEKKIVISREMWEGKEMQLKVTLEAKSNLLDSVVIVAKRAITVRGDTTIFNAESFGSKTEKKVEDLLKNLPGVQVDDEGGLKFKNKAISKVMINGIDLFSEDYKKLTKNLSSAYLDAVEIIENFSDNAVLKEFDFNKRSVINLKLKQSVFKLFGEADAAYDAFLDQSSLNANVFSLLGKLKIAAIANHNNIGNSLSNNGQNKRSLEDVLNPSTIQVPYNEMPSLIAPITAMGLGRARFLLNNDSRYSVNMATKVFKRIEVKADVTLSDIRNHQMLTQSRNFLLSVPALTIVENKRFYAQSRQSNANLRLTYAKSDKLKIDYKAKFYSSVNNAAASLTAIPQNDNEQIFNSSDLFFNSLLRVSKRMGFQKAGELEVAVQQNNTPAQYAMSPSAFDLFLGLPAQAQIQYEDKQRLSYLALKPKYFSKKTYTRFQSELQVTGSIEFTKQLQNNQFFGINNSQQKTAVDSTFNTAQKGRTVVSGLSAQYIIKAKKIEITINPGVSYAGYNFTGRLPLNENRREGLLIYDNSFSIKRNINQSRYLELRMQASSAAPPSQDLFRGYRLMDYRTFSKFDWDTLIVKGYTNRLQLMYSNVNIIKGKMLLANIALNKGRSNFLTGYDYASLINLQTRSFGVNPNNTVSSFILYEKTIPSISTRFTTNVFMFYFNRRLELGTANISQNSLTVDQEINLKTAFKKPYNFKASFAYSLSRQSSPLNNTSNFQYKVTTEAQLNTLEKRLLLKMIYQFVDYNQSGKGFHFLDATAQFTPTKGRLSYNMKVFNALNNKRYQSLYLSPETVLDRRILLQPRQMLAGVSYRF